MQRKFHGPYIQMNSIAEQSREHVEIYRDKISNLTIKVYRITHWFVLGNRGIHNKK